MSTTTTYAEIEGQIDRLFASPQLFYEWLKSKQPDDLVGMTQLAASCPLAHFAGENGLHVNVSGDMLAIDIDGIIRGFDTPEWVERFVGEIDAIDEDDSVEVLAAEALNELERHITITADGHVFSAY